MAGPRPLLIFPCNGTALEALDCLGSAHRCVAFVDDTPAKQGTEVLGVPVVGREALGAHADAEVLAVLGSPTSYATRRAVITGLGVAPERFARIVHPTARVSPHAILGRNVLVMAGVVVTSNAVIGDHVVILPNTVVHHDAVVGDWCLLGANVTIAGAVRLGENAYVASGTSVTNNVVVGAGALVGLGSTVIRDVAPGARVAGVPARLLATKATPR